MSAKILSSLTDDNRNLRKQIGCIFQIFDRRHLLSSRRLGHDQTKLDKPRDSIDSISRASNSSSETHYERSTRKEKAKQPKTPRSHDLRDVVKDSMYREAAAAHSTKQHIDSPRPLRPRPKDKQRSKDDHDETMAPRRYSYDGREGKNNTSATSMRVKELPRLSLDSRAGSIKFSSSESRLDFLDRFHVECENRSAEPGNHRRSSSVVAKLMGLESFPEENRSRNLIPDTKEIHHLQKKVSQSPASPSPRFRPVDSFQGSPKMAPQLSSSSVYGEIEKRIAELEFKKSGKDLRALKQILEAMHKTRERIEQSAEMSSPRRRHGSEDGSCDPKSNSPTWHNRKIKGPTSPKAVDRAAMDVLNVHRLSNSSTKSDKESITTPPRRKARTLEPRRDMELDRTLKGTRGSKAKSCEISAKSSVISSSRWKHDSFHDEEPTRPSSPTSDPVRVGKHLSKKVVERNSQDKRLKLKSKTFKLIDTQLNEVSGEVTCSSYRGNVFALPMEADNCVEQQKYLKTRREPVEEISIEQPSPVSVLDSAFYSEDPPSPVRKITLTFQDDEDQISDYRRSDTAQAYSPELEGSRRSAHEIRRVTSNPDITPSNNLSSPDMFHALEMEAVESVKPNQKYERKIILDMANEILIRKNMSFGGLYPAAGIRERTTSLQDLMKEACLELNTMSTIQNSNLDDEDDDRMLKLLASDMKHESEDWTRYKSEVPALVLDIERLIFKDLVNEVLTNATL